MVVVKKRFVWVCLFTSCIQTSNVTSQSSFPIGGIAAHPSVLMLCPFFFFFHSDEVISNLRDLQSLAINTSAEKEKQKAEVKHILQQKQRALSDLFKMLTEIGELSSLVCRCHIVI